MANDKSIDGSSESSETSCEPGRRSGSSSPASISAPPPASRTPELCEIGSNGKPVPTIKLQRKYASHWTCSSASKLRRGRVKLKLRQPISTDVAPAKDEALTSLRIATDLPRFNWLELKLSQQSSPTAPESHVSDRCDESGASEGPTTTLGPTKSVEMIPLKRRRLECVQSSQTVVTESPAATVRSTQDNVHNECRLPLKKRTDLSLPGARENRALLTSLKAGDSPHAEPSLEHHLAVTTTSKWPLKKRIISPANQDEPEPSSPVRNDSEEVNRESVICKNLILPPTPPSSSASTETSAESPQVQDEPLDLSKAVLTLESVSKSKPVNECADESSSEIQIVSQTKRSPSRPEVVHKEIPRRPELIPARPMTAHPQIFALNRIQSGILSSGHGAFKAVQKTPPTSLATTNDHHIGGKEDRIHSPHVMINSARDQRRPILPKENPPMTIRPVVPPGPFIHPPPVQPAQLNQIHYRAMPHQLNRSHSDSTRPLVRPFALPSTRLPPTRYPPVSRQDDGWVHSSSSGLIRNKSSGFGIGQAEVEILSPSCSFAMPRFFRPKDSLTPITFPKRVNIQPSTSISATPPARLAMPGFTSAVSTTNWPPSSFRCNVCLEAAGFKCAGCHLYAYCSTDCQAKDWPLHSRMCRVHS